MEKINISYLPGWNSGDNYSTYSIKDYNHFSILQIWATKDIRPYNLDNFTEVLEDLLTQTSCNHIKIYLRSKKHSNPLNIKKLDLMVPDSLEYMLNEDKDSIVFGYGCLGRIESFSTFEKEVVDIIKKLYPYFIVFNIRRIELH